MRVRVTTITGILLRDALVATFAAAVVAVLVNLLRSGGIPFFAEAPYEILVPCPEPGGAVETMTATDPDLQSDDTFIVDARREGEHKAWRFRQAMRLTYDYLDPTPPGDIAALARAIAKSKAKRVAVYGDGDTPDTGELLGKEISGHGIKNVFFVKGGAPALKAAEKGAR